jgi:membrane dipeptidase
MAPATQADSNDTIGVARATKLHAAALVWDAHACLPLLPQQSMAALERHRAAGANHVSVNVGMDFNPVSQVMRVIAGFREWIAEHNDRFVLAGSVAEVQQAKRDGKLSIAFDLEGSAMLEGDLAMLRLYRDLGVRQIHLAYNRDNDAAGGCHGSDAGLTPLGRQIVERINELGLIMDCSHSGHRTSLEIMEQSRRPVVFSHSNARALKDHPRNIWNDQIDACARTGGVIALSGIGIFLGCNDIRVDTLMRHIDYVAGRVGPEHVGIGLDYVFEKLSGDLPPGLSRDDWWPPGHDYDLDNMAIIPPESLPRITDALVAGGYEDAEILGILGGNYLRVAAATWG